MPKSLDLKKVLVIGSGPIVIGQAAEFDYAGTQACKSLREEGISVVLVNSNPATIMTDADIADTVYIQPLTVDALEYIIQKERPDGLLATLGGQTALNLAMELDESGILERYDLRLLGTSLDAIRNAEDRDLFKNLMQRIGEPVPQSKIVHTMAEGFAFAEEIGFPVIVRPAFTLGGTGGGIAQNKQELELILQSGFLHSRIHQVLLEQSVAGWKEIEYEVMRDSHDTCIVICNMENMDPIGIHTGDSIVVAPSQTLRDAEYQMLRSASLKIIRSLQIEGGCNVQFALSPTDMRYYVIEVNPRVSRSSALASKAAGYPIAKIAAKIAVGLCLHEMPNPITQKTTAAFEPTLDYITTKIPKWPFDKFPQADRKLGTQMKATGEVMAMDRSFERSFMKAVSSLELPTVGLRLPAIQAAPTDTIKQKLSNCDDERLFAVAEAFRRGMTLAEIKALTAIDPWFLVKIENLVQLEKRLEEESLSVHLYTFAKHMGYGKRAIQTIAKTPEEALDALESELKKPVFKMVDTCSAEFESHTPYYYSAYEQEDENLVSENEKIVVLGSGAIRIGQGIEFDYCSVHAAWAIQKAGYESILINNNPETVSTDFDTADKLFFEPLVEEHVLTVLEAEKPKGVIVQFGGQTALNLASALVKHNIPILGTSLASIDIAEDRKHFNALLETLGIPQPKGCMITSLSEALDKVKTLGYPVMLRPSYVIGGRAMQVIHNETALISYVSAAFSASPGNMLLMDCYLEGTEVEVDAICDGEDILIPGLMEHIEPTGVHSGDSFCVYPSQTLSKQVIETLVDYTRRIACTLNVKGLLNIQYAVVGESVYVIEANPRASRTVPILSKITQVPMVQTATEIILGKTLGDFGYGTGLMPHNGLVAVKAPVFSFQKLHGVDVALVPEMKSTGEVLGVDTCYEKALLKAFQGAGTQMPSLENTKPILVLPGASLSDELVACLQTFVAKGFTLMTTENAASSFDAILPVTAMLKENTISLRALFDQSAVSFVVNTLNPNALVSNEQLDFQARTLAYQYKVPCFTSVATLQAYAKAIQLVWQGEAISYAPLTHYIKQPSLTA